MIKSFPSGFLIIFVLSFSFLFFFLILKGVVFSQNGQSTCPPEPPDPSSSWTNSWNEYRCESNACAGNILIRSASQDCWQTYSPVTDDAGCIIDWQPTSSGCSPVQYSSPSIDATAGQYQRCLGSDTWTTTRPTFQCSGTCYPAPEPKGLDDPTLLPQNVADGSSYKLPINFGWKDNVEKAVAESPNFCTVGSYEFNIINPPIFKIVTTTTLQTIKDQSYKLECQLKPNTSYQWRVRACQNPDGTDCGQWSNPQNFTTSLAPEPILPYDPDWQDQDKTKDYPLPVLLSWCEIPSAKSYLLQAYKNGKPALFSPWPITKEDGNLLSQYLDEVYNFTKETTYQWEVAACEDELADQCGTFSQRWTFQTGTISLSPPERESPPYDPNKPNEIPVVNQLDSLKWKGGVLGAEFYRYQIKKDGEIIVDEIISPLEVKFNQIDSLWDSIDDFNQIYSWRVASCWGQEENQCDEFSEPPWFFKTTGAKPINLNANVTIIPVKLDWDDMDGAASYYYEVATDPGFTNIVIPEPQRVVRDRSEVLVDYPYLRQDTTYWWRVKTCADEDGQVCGDWSDTSPSFTTFKLGKPINPRPADGSEFYTYERYLRWDPPETGGAKFYQYKVDYAGTEKIPLTIVSSNYTFVDPPRQLELGENIWYVRACLDKDCQETGEWAGPWHFILVEKVPPGAAGLVPCGRDGNVPDPYDIDETESCGLQHIFLLLRNILDFVLWRLGLIVLVLLVLYSGVIFYFSGQLGFPEPLSHVKSLWRAAGLGYLIMFASYSLINLFLAIMGYNIGIFGPWWVIEF